MRNKVILVPLALLLSAIAPQLIGPILVLGGLFLCYEGAEKIWHHLAHSESLAKNKEALHQAAADTQQDLALFEADKVKGAIRTDFILSAEIIVITLGTAAQQSLGRKQAIVVSLIAIAMTVGVYGLVALIVKLDDIGIHLMQDQDDSLSGVYQNESLAPALLAFCPKLMKTLSSRRHRSHVFSGRRHHRARSVDSAPLANRHYRCRLGLLPLPALCIPRIDRACFGRLSASKPITIQ